MGFRVRIRGAGSSVGSRISDVTSLCAWMHETHAMRQATGDGLSVAVLLTAPPAAGKTCLVSQLVRLALRWQGAAALVPIALRVAELQRLSS